MEMSHSVSDNNTLDGAKTYHSLGDPILDQLELSCLLNNKCISNGTYASNNCVSSGTYPSSENHDVKDETSTLVQLSRSINSNLTSIGTSTDHSSSADGDDDNSNGNSSLGVRSEIIAINEDCCVKTVLISVVVSTAILLIVIMASRTETSFSQNKGAPESEEDVYWLTGENGPRLVLRHQFLIHDVTEHHPIQIIAIDVVRQMYVIEWLLDDSKHYNVYSIMNFQESTETYLVIGKSQNEYSTEVVETLVLFCKTNRFERGFHGSFASVSNLQRDSSSMPKTDLTKSTPVITYVGGPVKLSRIVSLVINSSCQGLKLEDSFHWGSNNESLACGEKVLSKLNFDSCPEDLCQFFPGIPLTRSQTCNKFRQCNFIINSCNPYYRHHPSSINNHPYCTCRKTAMEDARQISCPRLQDDDGECEIPRRDLLVTQSNLPCQCLYNFSVIYPIMITPDESPGKEKSRLIWVMKKKSVTGPALTFSKCSC